MRPRYWVQYTLLITACTGGSLAVQYHKNALRKAKAQCCQDQQNCPHQLPATPRQATDTPSPSFNQALWGAASHFIVYAR